MDKIETSIKLDKTEPDPHVGSILCSNIRSLKNSKLDFSDVEKEKGEQICRIL